MSSHGEISTQHQDGHAVIALIGEFDLANSDRLHEALHAELDGHPRHLVLDLKGVTFMDSTALGVIVDARQSADAAGRRLAVAGAPDAVVRLLTITQVDKLVTMHDDVETALGD